MTDWVGLGSDKHRTTFDGEVWWLERAPRGHKHPWVFYTEVQRRGRTVRDRQQEIGAQDLTAAKHAAEVWLGVSKLILPGD